MIRLAAACSLLMTILAGCVAAYDPADPVRPWFATRAEQLGTNVERPARVKTPATRRAARTPTPAPAPVQAQATTEPTAEPAPVPAATRVAPPAPALSARRLAQPAAAVEFPATPAGQQLKWFVSVLGGAATKDLESHFTDAFLEKVPGPRVREIARTWRRDQLADGPVELVRIEPDATPTKLVSVVRGKVTDLYTQIRLGVDDAGKISMLWIGPVADLKRGDIPNWARLNDRLRALPGTVSVAATEIVDGQIKEVHSFGWEHRLAIGSTFKLYILGALAEEAAAGRIKWDDPMKIRDDLKSLPSGRMQLEAEGAEFPVSRYAELMVSISDNTAADHLLFLVGRDKVEAYMARLNAEAARNRPFLSTLEMFKLKLGPDRTLADRYIKADEGGRRAMLATGGAVEQTTPSLAAAALWKAPYKIEELEWFATGPELCRLMADLHRLEQLPGMAPVAASLRLNPGLQLDSQTWKSIAYKGGSEPGVLNMTWLLERKDGRWFALSVGWNDPQKDVDVRTMAELAGAAVGLLAGVE